MTLFMTVKFPQIYVLVKNTTQFFLIISASVHNKIIFPINITVLYLILFYPSLIWLCLSLVGLYLYLLYAAYVLTLVDLGCWKYIKTWGVGADLPQLPIIFYWNMVENQHFESFP